MRPGRPKKHDFGKRFKNKRKAIIMAEVLKETGQLDTTEGYRRYSPNAAEITHKRHGKKIMLNEDVMDELEKILKIRDKDLLKKLTPEVIVQDLLDDLRLLNELVAANKTDWEAAVKLLVAKGIKQKLIGMAIGIWKAEKPQEREASAGELINALRNVGKGDN